ncbi:MAG: hypothetical protein ACOC3W_11970 [Thermodesulfobacteriota bacterium]
MADDAIQEQMEPRFEINAKRLWELAKEGKSAQELMDELDLRDHGALKTALQTLMAEKGETLMIDGLDRPSVSGKHTDRGNRIDPQMLEGTHFEKGDIFDVQLTGDKLTLTRKTPPPTS